MLLVYNLEDEAYTQQVGPSPADNNEELDEEKWVRGAAIVLGGTGEVQCTVP